MNTKRSLLWWGPPKRFSDRPYERKVGWLELFYDLVYVAAVGQLTHYLALHLSWRHVGYCFLFFSLIFWSWVNGSQYYDIHGNDGIRTRFTTFWQMLAIAGLAITLQDAFGGDQQRFAIALAVVQVLMTYLWWSVGLYDPSHRVFSKFYTIHYLAALLLIVGSIFTSFGTATLLWAGVLVLDLTPSLTGARTIVGVLRKRGEHFTASATLVERFGLFTIIVLAESILAIVSGVAEVKDKHPGVWIAFLLGILISFLLWCLYFDMTSGQETKKGYGYMQWLVYLHFPLLASFCVLGACMKSMLLEIDQVIPREIRWIFCMALAVILFMIVGISEIMQNKGEDKAYIRPASRAMLGMGFFILVIPLFGPLLGNILFLSLIAITLLVPVVIGIQSWVRYRFFSQK